MAAQPDNFVVTPVFSIGSILSRTVSTLFQNPLLFFGLAVIASVPTAIIDEIVSESFFGQAAAGFFTLFLGMVVQGIIAYAVFLALTGEEEPLSDILNQGLGQMGVLLVVALLTGLIFTLGFILFVIPGIILLCVLAVTAQACVVEQLGAMDSLNRSVELTRGYRWHIFGLYVVVGIIFFVVFALIGFVAALVFPGHTPIITTVINITGNVVTVAFDAVMCGIIYYDLRGVKEGVTLDALASIFD